MYNTSCGRFWHLDDRVSVYDVYVLQAQYGHVVLQVPARFWVQLDRVDNPNSRAKEAVLPPTHAVASVITARPTHTCECVWSWRRDVAIRNGVARHVIYFSFFAALLPLP